MSLNCRVSGGFSVPVTQGKSNIRGQKLSQMYVIGNCRLTNIYTILDCITNIYTILAPVKWPVVVLQRKCLFRTSFLLLHDLSEWSKPQISTMELNPVSVICYLIPPSLLFICGNEPRVLHLFIPYD